MRSSELKKWLRQQGCEFQNHEGGSGHLTVINPKNNKRSQLPMHSGKELGKGLERAIKKQLGLE